MSTLLVIGGSGFFGKSIIDAYLRGLLRPWKVDCLIALSRHASDLASIFPNYLDYNIQFLNLDISSAGQIPFADYVIHAATSTDLRDYLNQPELEKDNIKVGIDNYCELAKRFHKNSKIVYTSSGAVYGTQSPDVENMHEDSLPTNVEHIGAGKKDYAIAKQNAELAIIRLGSLGINVSIARCYAFVGKWLPRNQHFAIGNFIQNGIDGVNIQVKAKHQVFRSYMYADDLVVWLMTIADNANPQCPIYNVGSDQAVSIHELGKIISEYFQVGATIEDITTDNVDRYVPSIKKAQEFLGVKLEYDLISAITHTVLRIKNEQAFDLS